MRLPSVLLILALASPSVALGAFPSCLWTVVRSLLQRKPVTAPAPEAPLKPPEEARAELFAWLEEAPGRERELVGYLSQRPWLRELFNSRIVYIGVHTSMVLDECAQRWAGIDWKSIAVPKGFALEATVKVAIALHDIGKGLPDYWRLVGRRTQHDLTVPLLEKAMAELGFQAEEIALATALVGHDELGRTIQRFTTVDKAFKALVRRQQSTVLSPKDFFRVQTFYYVADVASYFHLRDEVLDASGRIVSQRFKELAQKFDAIP